MMPSGSKKIITFLLSALVLAGCTYLKNDLRAELKSECLSYKIGPDIFLVYCAEAEEKDYAVVERNLVREASRTALRNGFSHFLILKEIYKSRDSYLETSGPAGVMLGYADSETIDIDFIKERLGLEPKFSLIVKCFGSKHPWGAFDAKNFLKKESGNLKAKEYYNKWQ